MKPTQSLNISEETFKAATENKLPELVESVKSKKLKMLTPSQRSALEHLESRTDDWQELFALGVPGITTHYLTLYGLIKSDSPRSPKRYSITPAGIEALKQGYYLLP